MQMEGYLSHSNLISVGLDLNLKNISEICFSVKVNNATNTVNVEGTYKFGEIIIYKYKAFVL